MTGRWAADDPAAALVFLPDLAERLAVSGADGHHLARVRRLGVGEYVTGADGRGRWRPYRVVATGRDSLDLAARGGVVQEPDPSPAVVVAPALVKAGLDVAIAALTALGVTAIRPWVAEHSVVRLDTARTTRTVDRWRRIARESAMQCRRARLPAVHVPAGLAALLAHGCSGAGPSGTVVVAERAGAGPAWEATGRGPWLLVTGPEAGFGPADRRLLAPAPRLSVGPHVLRAEHAPIVACAALLGAVDQP